MSNKLKVTAVSAEGLRLADGGRKPDVLVKIRLLSKALPSACVPVLSRSVRAVSHTADYSCA